MLHDTRGFDAGAPIAPPASAVAAPAVTGRRRRRKIAGDGHDFYPTQLWAVLGLLDELHLPGPVWECACGDGEMAMALKLRGLDYFASDLVDRGYGTSGVDFMTSEPDAPFGTVFTNPPFKDAEAFVRRARSFRGVAVCMFLPLSFLQGAGRASGLWADDPPDLVLVVPDRVTMYPRGDERPESGSHASAWFVWYGVSPKPGFQPPVGWLEAGAQHRYREATATVRKELRRRELERRRRRAAPGGA